MLVNMTQTLLSSTFVFSDLKPGNTIAVKGNASSGLLGYYHVGIYLGNEEVINYTNYSKVQRINRDSSETPSDVPACHTLRNGQEGNSISAITRHCQREVSQQKNKTNSASKCKQKCKKNA